MIRVVPPSVLIARPSPQPTRHRTTDASEQFPKRPNVVSLPAQARTAGLGVRLSVCRGPAGATHPEGRPKRDLSRADLKAPGTLDVGMRPQCFSRPSISSPPLTSAPLAGAAGCKRKGDARRVPRRCSPYLSGNPGCPRQLLGIVESTSRSNRRLLLLQQQQRSSPAMAAV